MPTSTLSPDTSSEVTGLTLYQFAQVAWYIMWRFFLIGLLLNHDSAYYASATLSLTARRLAGNVLGNLIGAIFVLGIAAGYLYVVRWILLSLLQTHFVDFRLRFVRDNTEGVPSFKDTFRILWLLHWRAVIIGVAVGAVYGCAFPDDVRLAVPRPFSIPPEQSWVHLFQYWQPWFIGYPWAISVMLQKRFKGFHFAVATTRHCLTSSDETQSQGWMQSTSLSTVNELERIEEIRPSAVAQTANNGVAPSCLARVLFCQNCQMKVLPTEDRTCPSCQRMIVPVEIGE